MNIDIGQRLMLRLARMAPEEQRAWLAKCAPEDLLLLDTAFEAWADAGQIAPDGEGWRVWLMMAGRGFGKTRAGAEWVMRLASQRKVRFALVGATIDDARSVMIEGESGLLTVARRAGRGPETAEPGARGCFTAHRRRSGHPLGQAQPLRLGLAQLGRYAAGRDGRAISRARDRYRWSDRNPTDPIAPHRFGGRSRRARRGRRDRHGQPDWRFRRLARSSADHPACLGDPS